jgi:hypothetical protein
MTMSSMLQRAAAVRQGRLRTLGACALALAVLAPAWAQDTGGDVPTRVGRLSSLAGQIYLAPPDQSQDWSPVDLNYPVTNGDNLWAAEGARAEVDFGGSQMRMSAATNVNVGALDDHNLDLFVAQGDVILRLNVLEAGDSVVIDTPATQVVLRRPGLYRVFVSPDQRQTAVTVREGEVTAQVTAGLQQVLPGMTATIVNADNTAAQFGAAMPLDGFDAWSADRERYFRQAANTRYVSQQMVGYSDLANYGAWQSYPDYGNVWFPSGVPVGWAPYSDGYWTTVPAFGLTWVDRAPWGYAPFHYGRWAYVGSRWGWVPGAYVARPVWAPALVAWTGGGLTIAIGGGGPAYGWVPLGWREPYQPWWGGCRGACWDRYNRPYHVDVQYRDHAPSPERFANWRVPGAVTAVAGANLIARKPYVASERVSLTGSALAAVKPGTSVPPLVHARPNSVPVLRAGAQGTPKPAADYYATSKPARLGLQPTAVRRAEMAAKSGGSVSTGAGGAAAVNGAPPGPGRTPYERSTGNAQNEKALEATKGRKPPTAATIQAAPATGTAASPTRNELRDNRVVEQNRINEQNRNTERTGGAQQRNTSRNVTTQAGNGPQSGNGQQSGNGAQSGIGAQTGNGDDHNNRMKRAPHQPPQAEMHTESRTVTAPRGNPPLLQQQQVQGVQRAPQVNATPAVVNNPPHQGGGNGPNAHENKGNDGHGRDEKNDKNDKNDQKH